MSFAFSRVVSSIALVFATALLFSSCTVDQDAALFAAGNGSGSATKKKTSTVSTGEEQSWAEKMKSAREEREKAKAEAAEKKAKDLAAKKKAEEKAAKEAGPSFAERMAAAREEREKAKAEAAEKKAKELAAKKKAEEKEAKEAGPSFAERMAAAREEREKAKAEADKERAKELAAKKKAELAAKKDREKMLAEKAAEAKKHEEAKLAAKKKAEEERAARKLAARSRSNEREVEAVAERTSGGGFFSRLAVGTPSQYKSDGHDIFVNQRLLSSLSPSNAKIEVDLSEQRARVYKTGAGGRQLVIDTAVSSGKSGHSTPAGTFRIKEKLVHKRSTLYGTWMSSSGSTVRSSGDSRNRPSGGSSFVGAEMPYWMRINGGIGMHIGYVPNYPASHGCIRVPSAIQPLIYSKVGVGTSVTIKH
ncbi:MAG: L,D-transpeptidase [Verrucomicrobiales bacterium]|nr:L,D-transpeptidase [Verrucomicrobiales bacterium]